MKAAVILQQKGFTLLELLVALAVFAVMSTAAYSGLSSVLFTHASVTTEAERLAQVQMGFYLLERDMIQVVGRGIRDEFGQQLPALMGGDASGNLITLTRAGWDNPLGHQRATLQRVAYRLEEKRLLRLYWDTLDRSGVPQPRELVLLDGVQDMEVRFLNTDNAWQTRWPPDGGDDIDLNTLPGAVEISLTLTDWGELTRLFRLAGG